jgi:two-component system, NarL family, sensor histidine kinase DesK
VTDGEPGLGSFRRYTWWSLAGAVTVFLVLVVGARLLALPVWAKIVGAVALAVVAVASVVLFSRRLDTDTSPPAAWMIAGSVGAAVLGGILLVEQQDGAWSLAPAIMVSLLATFLPRRRWVLLTGAAVAAAVLGGIDGDWGLRPVLFPPGLIAFVAWSALGMLWAWDVAERLNAARQLAARLAVAQERLRFAADLHDIQGHHLQVIARKGELAARLAAVDPTRAAAEMRDVQQLATDALKDTRAVVQGYRRTTLDGEIANAAKVLAAAEIQVEMNLSPSAGELPDYGRHLLGLVVREATTNVLRHSQARSAEVDYRLTDGLAWLEVRNDGATAPSESPGTGLRGLAERLQAAGGELTWEHRHDRFVVAASLPVGTR